jgi:Sulfotransferase family
VSIKGFKRVAPDGRVTRSWTSRLAGRLRETRDETPPRLDCTLTSGPTELETGPPIFVVGCQRSGTSLLRRVLDSHSNIACPPESHFVLPLLEALKDDRSMWGLTGMGYTNRAIKDSLARLISGFFIGYAAAQGKRRWADKTPRYVDCLFELHDLFPGACFLVVIRNGLDVAFSLADAHRHYPAIDAHVAKADGNVAVGAGRFWAEQNHKIQMFVRERPDACHVLRYEELTTNPATVLRAAFSFLGEPWEPEVIDYGSFADHGGLEDPDVKRRRRVEPNSGRHLAWPPEIADTVREACEPLFSSLGYS